MARTRARLGALLTTTLVAAMITGACSLIPTDDQPRALTPLPEPEERDGTTTDTGQASASNSTMVCVYLWDRDEGVLFPQRVSAFSDTPEERLRALMALDNEAVQELVAADPEATGADIETNVLPDLRVADIRQGDDQFVIILSEEFAESQGGERLPRLFAQLVYTATVGEPASQAVDFKRRDLESETGEADVTPILPNSREENNPVTRANYEDFQPARADIDACESRDAVDESTTSAGEDPTDDTTTTAAPAGAAVAELDAPAGGSDVTTATGDEPARAGAVPTTDTAGPGPTTTVGDGQVTTTTVEETTTTVG